MHKRSVGAVAALLAIVLMSVLSAPVSAAQTASLTAHHTTGAGHTYPAGAWGYSDGCQTGITAIGGTEYRCAFEFDLSSIPTGALVTSAVLQVRRSAGCATNDCPVDLAHYTGDGVDSLADVLAGSNIATFTPNSYSPRYFNVTGLIKFHVEEPERWAGFRLSRSSTSTHVADVQDYDISTADQLRLVVEYVAQPVFVTVEKSGPGSGTVTSNPASIDCGSDCEGVFEYAEPVTLTATPDGGYLFDEWLGEECAGQDATCEFIVPSIPGTITAVFKLTSGVTAPPPTEPPPTEPQLTPPPLTPPPSAGASVKPSAKPSGGVPSAGPSAGASGAAESPVAGGIPSPGSTLAPGATLEPGATPAPTAAPSEPAGGSGGGSPLPLILLLVVGVLAIGGGWFAYQRRRGGPAPGA